MKLFGCLHGDLGVAKCGNIAAERVGKHDLAALHQDHRGDRGNRFGHRGERENCVGRHAVAQGAVAEANRLQPGELAMARNRKDRAGDAAFCYPGVEDSHGLGQALSGKANGFRGGERGDDWWRGLRCGGWRRWAGGDEGEQGEGDGKAQWPRNFG